MRVPRSSPCDSLCKRELRSRCQRHCAREQRPCLNRRSARDLLKLLIVGENCPPRPPPPGAAPASARVDGAGPLSIPGIGRSKIDMRRTAQYERKADGSGTHGPDLTSTLFAPTHAKRCVDNDEAAECCHPCCRRQMQHWFAEHVESCRDTGYGGNNRSQIDEVEWA